MQPNFNNKMVTLFKGIEINKREFQHSNRKYKTKISECEIVFSLLFILPISV